MKTIKKRERKTENINVRVTPSLKDRLTRLSSKSGVGLSELIDCILDIHFNDASKQKRVL